MQHSLSLSPSARPFNVVWHRNTREVDVKQTFPYKHWRGFFFPPLQSCQRRGRWCERITRFCNSLASYASLLFWRPPVSGLIEMFSQSRASELSIETVLEITVSILGRPLAPCQTNMQKEDSVGNKSRKIELCYCREKGNSVCLPASLDLKFLRERLRFAKVLSWNKATSTRTG